MSSSNVPRQEIFSKFKEIIRELDWRKTLADEDIKARLRGALPGISDADFNNILVHHTTVVPADAPYTVTIKFKPKIDTAPEPVIFVGTSGPPVGDHESTGYIAIISEEDAAAVKEFTVVHDPVTDPSLGIEFSADNTIYATYLGTPSPRKAGTVVTQDLARGQFLMAELKSISEKRT